MIFCQSKGTVAKTLRKLEDKGYIETLEDNAAVLKSLADPTRLKIIYLLKNGELCVCQILEAIDKTQSTISHHLNIMKKEGVLSARKEGKWIYYKLANENIIDSLEEIFEN